MQPHPCTEIISWRTRGLIIVAVSCLCWYSACIQVGRFGLVTLPSDSASFPASVFGSYARSYMHLCLYQQWLLQCWNVTGVVSCNLLIRKSTDFFLERTTQRNSVKVLYKPCSNMTLSRWTVIRGFHVAASWLLCFDERFNRLCLVFAYSNEEAKWS